MKEKGHGIVLDEKGQEQPKDKERARTANQTEPGNNRSRKTTNFSP
jgi:hypothetical protein